MFPNRSDTNRAVQPDKMATSLKFRIYEVEELCYLCSENKGADQLRGYREADLRLCFRICKKTGFSRRGSYLSIYSGVPRYIQCSISVLSNNALVIWGSALVGNTNQTLSKHFLENKKCLNSVLVNFVHGEVT